MKATRSRDGVPRVTVRIEHRLDLDGIVTAICWHMRYEWEPGDEVRLTKSSAVEMVRTAMRSAGAEAPGYWRDAMDESEEADELEEAVTAEIRRLFPSL